jgi:hypothetical protein
MISTLDNLAASPARTLSQIETLAAGYDGECAKLEALIESLEADLDAARQKHLRGLKRQAAAVAASQAALHVAVEASPALFVKPRTLTLHGTKLGYASSEGRVGWNDEARVVQLIRRHFPERFDELVKTELTPKKDALRDLAAADLARLGCRIEGAGEQVLVRRVTGDVEKLIQRLTEKMVAAMVERE